MIVRQNDHVIITRSDLGNRLAAGFLIDVSAVDGS